MLPSASQVFQSNLPGPGHPPTIPTLPFAPSDGGPHLHATVHDHTSVFHNHRLRHPIDGLASSSIRYYEGLAQPPAADPFLAARDTSLLRHRRYHNQGQPVVVTTGVGVMNWKLSGRRLEERRDDGGLEGKKGLP